MRTLAPPVVALAALLSSACYTTRFESGRVPMGPQHSELQWFTMGGLVPLSRPAGATCTDGLARAASEYGAVDILLNTGITTLGLIAGSAACGGLFANGSGNPNNEAAAVFAPMCVSLGMSLAPLLLGTRTVTYECAAPSVAVTAPATSEPALAGRARELGEALLGQALFSSGAAEDAAQ